MGNWEKWVWGAGVAGVLGALTVAVNSQAVTVQVCPDSSAGGPSPVISVLNATESAVCWTGSSWETGTSWSKGKVTSTSGSGRSVGAYAFYNLEHNPPAPGLAGSGWGFTQAYNSSNVVLSGCSVSDSTGDGAWTYNTSSACNGAAYVIVRAYATALH